MEVLIYYARSPRPTALGADAIPAWFLRVGTPGFAAPPPLAELLNQSISAGVVPQQWKVAAITPVTKIAIAYTMQ